MLRSNLDLSDSVLDILQPIKQGYDHPVCVTAEITRPLVPFTGIYNVCVCVCVCVCARVCVCVCVCV